MDVQHASEKRNRAAERSRCGVVAEIMGRDQTMRYPCFILDASAQGCRIYCDSIEDLPDEVLLHPQGISNPIPALIRWRKKMIAGLSLDWPAKAS